MKNLNEKIADILIVDDVPANLVVLRDMLVQEGYRVRPVPSGSLALTAAQKEKPDLILLDIMMPEMDGYRVAARMKQISTLSDVPIIFISALNETDDVVKAFKSDGVDFITKPFRAEEVLARVATHLKISRLVNELKRINHEKDTLFSIVAHDLRGPIGFFSQVLELLANEKEIREESSSFLLQELQKMAKSVFALLENLLNWARIQSKSLQIRPVQYDIRNAIHENVEMLIPMARQKSIRLTADASAAVPVFADKESINLVIRNLIANAIKFTLESGTITVSAKNNGSQAEVAVKDSGIGMTEEAIENLFRTFSTTFGTRGEKGSGLGLVLCKEFVEKNGGTIRVESQPGRGSKFIFTVPRFEHGVGI